ncbi:MAG: hypothetical protein M1814_005131 [Vezdaea aestivalis]|nr:MAG: hypothetical protein M1814_005131 [Vezdaea aestivalis]
MASNQHQQDELAAEETAGFKVGKQTTLKELETLDNNDESLVRWKQSLLGAKPDATDPDANNPDKVSIVELALESEGIEDIVLDLQNGDVSAKLKEHVFKIKEGATFRMRVKFKVRHEIISGLKYIQVVKRGGVKVSKLQEMIGSYAPNNPAEPIYKKLFAPDEAPSGILARGKYKAVSRFVDDDNVNHLEFEWHFEITKKW